MKYVDIHCHPSLKPYSKSFKYLPIKQNHIDPNRKSSIWHYSPPNFLEKLLNRIFTVTKFTQTDFTSLAKSKSKVVVIALYPFEKHFFGKEIIGIKGVTDALVNLASGISQSRIDAIRNSKDYFVDLLDEYDYCKQLHNQVVHIDGVDYTYRLVKDYKDIETNLSEETDLKQIISVLISIEGSHSFNTGIEMNKDMASRTEVLQNILTVKTWQHRPLFITFAHHFYNELCGHARSISIKLLKDNQNRGLDNGITQLGYEAIELLLENNENKRIAIDVKHMSVESRCDYYNLLDTFYSSEKIPVIVSHGCCNGRRSFAERNKMEFPEHREWFCNIDINFYDEELIRISKSNGIFGIQLDERRIASKRAINTSKIYFPNKRKQLKKKALLVWRQVEHIAEILDKENLYCWGIQSIGSDFDGIVNPINGLWTAENMKDLADEVLNHAEAYISINSFRLKNYNRIGAKEIVNSLMHQNAMDFIQRNY